MALESQSYTTQSYRMENRGLVARYLLDEMPPHTFMDLQNCESRIENAISSRLGRIVITENPTGMVNTPLPTAVNTLSRLKTLSNTYRYAGAGTSLYRRTGDTQGTYGSAINSGFGLSGNRFSTIQYRPSNSSNPWLFLADAAAMLKDNGTLSTVQYWGLFAPYLPATAVVGSPLTTLIDAFSSTATMSFTNVTGTAASNYVNTTTSAAITVTGVQAVAVAAMTNIIVNALLVVDSGGSKETVQVISTTATTFTANFTKTHLTGVAVVDTKVVGTVAASTAGTIVKNFTGNLNMVGTEPAAATDLISINMLVSNQSAITEIRLAFDVGDGTFSQSYYWKAITPSITNSASASITTAQQALQATILNQLSAQAIAGNQLNVRVQQEETQVAALQSLQTASMTAGNSVWMNITAQRGSFVTVGQAGLPGHDWGAINSWQIQIITNAVGSVGLAFSDFYLQGGSGPDSTGGIGYDYEYTYYNILTGVESNPSPVMIPANLVYPVRQPVTIGMAQPVISTPNVQATHFRLYRRGGSLSQGWYLIAQIPTGGYGGIVYYQDVASDLVAEVGQLLSLTNDPPVTSLLQTPVNTTLGTAVTAGSTQTVTPGSMANIYPNQVMTIDPNTSVEEQVFVYSTTGTQFTAFFQYAHASTASITATARTGQPCNIAAQAFGQVWLAGDPNNPHFLYYSIAGSPENFPATNYLEIGLPSEPIMAIVPFQSVLYVFTTTTVYQVLGAYQAQPVSFKTSTSHGLKGSWAVAAGETDILFQSYDGIYLFNGESSQLVSEQVDWLFDSSRLGPVSQNGANAPASFIPIPPCSAAPSDLANTVIVYFDKEFYVGYTDTSSVRRRAIFSPAYPPGRPARWRNDTAPVNAMYVETDVPNLVYSDSTGMIYQDRVGYFDSAGFVGSVLTAAPMALALQTASNDLGAPKNNKVFNEFSIDIDTAGVPVALSLLFDEGVTQVSLGNVTSNGRGLFNFNINAGQGQLSRDVALLMQVTINTTTMTAPITLYEYHTRAFVEGETRQSIDGYWSAFGEEGFKIIKQCWVEYNAPSPVNFSFYVEGNDTTPAYTFTLPATTGRFARKVRFPAFKFKIGRYIATSTADFYFYEDRSFFEMKLMTSDKGYLMRPIT